jgi:hypothetical protein
VAAAQDAAISTAIVGDNNTIETGFAIEYHRIDAATRSRIRASRSSTCPRAGFRMI